VRVWTPATVKPDVDSELVSDFGVELNAWEKMPWASNEMPNVATRAPSAPRTSRLVSRIRCTR